MKKLNSTEADQEVGEECMRPEYDFSGGIRGKYAKPLREQGYIIRIHQQDGTFEERFTPGERIVVLEPDVWQYFPNSQAVNHALRTLIALVSEKALTTSEEA